ncbi:hypothetical protein [Filifactor alocis]
MLCIKLVITELFMLVLEVSFNSCGMKRVIDMHDIINVKISQIEIE